MGLCMKDDMSQEDAEVLKDTTPPTPEGVKIGCGGGTGLR